MQPLRIPIPKELFSPAEMMHVDESIDADAITAGPDTVSFPGPLHVVADITNTGNAFLITGHVTGVGKTACARCLEDTEFEIDGILEGYFLVSSDTEAPDDMEADEFDVLSDDKVIDLTPLIESAILLDLPRVPLCSDDCKGLCPICGTNLNVQTCDCKVDEPSSTNPFSVLKDIEF